MVKRTPIKRPDRVGLLKCLICGRVYTVTNVTAAEVLKPVCVECRTVKRAVAGWERFRYAQNRARMAAN